MLVTGGTGFLGANLLPALLRRRASVHVLSRGQERSERLDDVRREIQVEAADLSDAASVRQAVERVRPDLVFHLAVQRDVSTPAARAAALSTNVLGTAHLLEAVRLAGCHRLVALGSSLEYGPRDEPARESDPLAPASFYGATKAAATLLLQQAVRADRLPIVVLRPYLLYGPWDAAHHLVPTAIRTALGGNAGGMPLTGPGLRRDWIFVEDVVEACLHAATADGVVGGVFNVATGRQWSNEEVVEAVEAVTGRPVRVRVGEFPARPTDRACWVADVSKARRVLGWEPRHTLHEGLLKTLEWITRGDARFAATGLRGEPA